MVKSARSAMPSALATSAPPALAVDDAEGVLHDAALGAQVLGGEDELPAGGHDVLDDEEVAPGDVAALAHLLGAVLLGLLADEEGGQTGHGGELVATARAHQAEFEPGQSFDPLEAPAERAPRRWGRSGRGRTRSGTCRSSGRPSDPNAGRRCLSGPRRCPRGQPTSHPHSACFPHHKWIVWDG